MEKGSPLKKLEELAQKAKERGFSSENKEVPDTEKEARTYFEAAEIMGESFYGVGAVEKTFGVRIMPDKIPPIPFGKQELERAKELRQELILYVDKDRDGKPLTIAAMREYSGNKTTTGTDLHFDEDRPIKDSGLDIEVPRLGWRLTSKECIPDSEDKDYFDQTEILIDYLKTKVFKNDIIPKPYADAFAEWDFLKSTNLKQQSKSMNYDETRLASKIFSHLKITELSRERLSEVAYRFTIHEKKNGERLLDPDRQSVHYTWTNSRDSNGHLANIGAFDGKGADIRVWNSWFSSSDTGVCFSRGI